MTRNRRTGEFFVPPHPAVLGVARIRCDSRDAERELRGGGRGGGEGGVNRRSGVLGMCDESGRNWRGREGGRVMANLGERWVFLMGLHWDDA